MDLLTIYRTVHDQGFIPIFTHDAWDPRRKVEACAQAGARVIEYTLRCPDARELIPWIRCEHPDLVLLVGSTLDDEGIVRERRRQFPQLMSVAELADLGVHGFVSMIGWSAASIRRYCRTHVLAPSASTLTEAFQQTAAGAHFQKMLGNNLDFVKLCRAVPTFDFCPVMVTGGMTLERLPEAIAAGAMVIGSGFDLTLKSRPADLPTKEIAAVTAAYIAAVQAARARKFPALAAAANAPAAAWLAALPHWHPFGG